MVNPISPKPPPLPPPPGSDPAKNPTGQPPPPSQIAPKQQDGLLANSTADDPYKILVAAGKKIKEQQDEEEKEKIKKDDNKTNDNKSKKPAATKIGKPPAPKNSFTQKILRIISNLIAYRQKDLTKFLKAMQQQLLALNPKQIGPQEKKALALISDALASSSQAFQLAAKKSFNKDSFEKKIEENGKKLSTSRSIAIAAKKIVKIAQKYTTNNHIA